jgi:hypothetical protein
MTSAITTPICDFCSDPNPIWNYPCATYELDLHGVRTEVQEGWLACESCARHIEEGQWALLARRGLLTPTAKLLADLMGQKQALNAVFDLHRGFRNYRKAKEPRQPVTP